MVAFHAENGRVGEVEAGGAEIAGGGGDAVDGDLAGSGISNNAAFADVLAAGFELGLDEDDGGAVPEIAGGREGGEDGGEDEGGGDEGDVHGEEGWGGDVGGKELGGGEEAGVGALAEGDA